MESPQEELKIYIIVRKDIKMGVGKIAGQTGHAIQQLILNGNSDLIKEYISNGIYPKIVLKVDSLDLLNKIESECLSRNIPTTKVIDVGRTQLEPGTITVLGIGPITDSKRPDVVKNLKLL